RSRRPPARPTSGGGFDRVGRLCPPVVEPWPRLVGHARALHGRRWLAGREAGYQRLLLGRVWFEQHLLCEDEALPGHVCHLVLPAEDYRLHRAGVLTVAAKDAAEHVDLVDLREALAGADPVLRSVLGRDHKDAADRTCRGAELTAYAALETVVVAAKIVTAAVAFRTRRLLFRILGRH